MIIDEYRNYETTVIQKNEYIMSILSDNNMTSSDGYWEGQFMYFLRLKNDDKKDISVHLNKFLIYNKLCLRKFYEQYMDVYNMAKVVHLLSIKYIISKNAKLLSEICLQINDILDKEKNILQNFINIEVTE